MDYTPIIVSIIGSITSIITMIISTKTNTKVKKQNEIREETTKEIKKLKEETFSRLDDMEYNNLKRYLTRELAEIESGTIKDEEQKKIIHESYDRYHNSPEKGGLGGNSYIKAKYERAVEKGIL